MAEIAGLVLGGIPIAIWALEKYVEPFEAFHNYRTSIETFRTDLILQHRQLQITLCNIGLDDEPSSEELRECFETKFPGISRELTSIVQRMDQVTAVLLRGLDIDVNGKSNTLPDRAQWEWRRVKHSFSTKKRNKVIEDLRHWNDDLRRSLEKPELPAEDDSGKVQDLKRRFNIQRCNSVRQCLSSLHRALESGFRCACSPPHQVAIDLDWTKYEAHTAKPFNVAVSYGTTPQPQLPQSWRKLDVTSYDSSKMASSAPKPLAPSPPPVITPPPSSSLRSRMVQFMFRPLSRTPSPPPTPSDLSTISTTVSTPAGTEITNLCDAVCMECDLAGLLKDPDPDQGRQFCLDHRKTDFSKIIRAVPLKSLLSSHAQSTQQQSLCTSLSAKQRFGIAASTAWSVLHLSGSPWLGDYWDERQTKIFIQKSQSGREVLSRHPCAFCIFSSPSTPEEPPVNDFKHLIPNRTVFSLGILLIELCIGRSFAEIRQVGGSTKLYPLFDDFQTALGKLDEVYRLAGDSYGDAAARCVRHGFQGRDQYKDFQFSQFRQQFYDAVVAPVQATYLMFPDSRIPV
ncbi:hypothetical protein NUU61_008826 [Penicillium alfredii]|uniref:DUF7580 domain-containing protein n=1 Tax=Penicillium alfredii TaxID=1506179 RepID=A0A9W9ELY7_9EURO|nr:uncharacterized protein NUU61_008826 [Penicillium alfredii]KAJ5084247.1 hypothetical protein NUU61_008826 [Penicillium alfredii]